MAMSLGAGVAIVGIGCRFPGGVFTPGQYWDFMLRRDDAVIEIPQDRWNVDLFYDADPDAPGRAYTRHGGFVTLSPWDFDAEFFGISPREAEVMDPQQRWVLEVAWEALDDAGMSGAVSGGNVGVYVGGFMSDNQIRRHLPSARRAINNYTGTSSSLAMVSNRLSYALDLRGPSMTIDTACSSSLVAIHQATQAVVRGECDVALAGGVNVMIHPEVFVTMCKGKFLARDGRCKSFDAAADGYGRGEGAGMIVLKPVDAALRDGDRIYAVIAGSGANQDGRTMGITVPNGVAQRDLARQVCGQAGLTPDQIGYVEAHGTGTAVGDPIEVTAMGEAYSRDELRTQPLLIGSVKSSIGHLEAASGVAGVIKAALAVHHRTIPPQVGPDTLNPAIPFGDLNVEVVTETTPFPAHSGAAIAAVNSFGYGGTNAHVILAEPPETTSQAGTAQPSVRLLPISAASEDAVRDVAAAMRSVVATASTVDDLCSAAWSRRTHHQFRALLSCSDADELMQQLDDTATGTTTISRKIVPTGTKPVFVFSGMGPQWWGMGRELLGAGGAFARTADEVDSVFTQIAGWSILDEMRKPETESRIQHTEYAQPANFLLQVALAAELAELGIGPAAIVGHSVGEVSAAYVSGVLTLRDALTVSHHRGRLQATTEGTGAMLAAELSESEAQQRLSEASEFDGAIDMTVAAINGPRSVTFAGRLDAIERLQRDLDGSGVWARRLQVTVPYHSALMDPILDDLVSVLADIQPRPPSHPLYSTVSAARISAADWDAKYWCANVRKPVRFGETIETLIGDGHRVFLEVGPHPVLSGNIRAIVAHAGEPGVAIPTLRRGESDQDNMVRTIGELYRAGCLGGTAPGRRAIAPHVNLPRYPWQHKTFRAESRQATLERTGGSDNRPLLGARSDAHAMAWSAELSDTRLPWLADHVVDGMVLAPGAAYLDAFLSATAECTGHASLTVESVRFVAPLAVDAHTVPKVSVTGEPSTMRLTFASHGDDTGDRMVHATARMVDAAVSAPQVTVPEVAGGTEGHDDFYARLASRGLQYGPAFRRVVEARAGADVVVATIDPGLPDGGHVTHPVVIDAALQAMAALEDLPPGTLVPAGVGMLRRHGRTPPAHVTAVVRRRRGPGVHADISLSGPDGTAFLELLDVVLAPLTPPVPAVTELGSLFYEMDWRPVNYAGALYAERPVLTVVLGGDTAPASSGWQLPLTLSNGSGAARSHPLRRWARRRAAGAERPIRPADLAGALHELEHGKVTILVVAGTGDQVHLVAGLAEVATQIDLAVGRRPDADVDAVLLTFGGFRLPGDRHDPNAPHAALVGARRAVQNEQITVRWRHVDLEPGADPVGWDAAVLHEIFDGEQRVDEVAVRHGALFAPYLRRSLDERLAPYAVATPHTDPEGSFVLGPPSSRLLDDVELRSAPRTSPGPGQIEVRMNAIGLNYKDSMKLLGVLTPQNLDGTFWRTEVGMEGVGVVTRADARTRFQVGDVVLVAVPGMFRRYLTVDPADGVIERLTLDAGPELAGSFVPLLAAQYGLVHAARLGAGETVLVHGAAGGTGLAAIQVARHVGARVIGSASTPERRAFAHAAGAEYTVDSRSANFVDDVMRLTDGRGADVIYTSLPGEFLRQNLKAAAEFGRIVDIGKADIYSNGVLELGSFDRNLQYLAVDMDRMFTYRRELAGQLTEEIVARLNDGTYAALPATIYDADRLSEALGVVARGAQQGRVVVTLGGHPAVRPAMPQFTVHADVTYLVTGGFGAVGLSLTDWLVAHGARHLIVASRNGARSEQAQSRLRAWRSAGAEVRDEAVDISDAGAVADLIAAAAAQMPALRGVFHTAGVVEDSTISNITHESLRRAMAAKLDGAWNLHNATEAAGIRLEAFVLFSSVTAVVGGALQVGYAAANAGLDALAQLRHAHGQPALSVNWGALQGGGMADSSAAVRRYIETLGYRGITVGRVPELLSTVLGLADDVSNAVVAGLDWPAVLSAHPASKNSTRFGEFAADLGSGEDLTFSVELLALPEDQRAEVLTLVLAGHVAALLGISADSLDPHTPLPELGLDSLASVELSSRLAAKLGIRIPAIDFGRMSGLSAIAKQALAGMEA
jgi:acyl transferase domain-containing protein/NADPH:quinone reductase-like Zn-dependent oxidoreductase/acyl carrier protein